MKKVGTKYINESEDTEWFDDVSLSNMEFKTLPPVGTYVKIKFYTDLPCRDEGSGVEIAGEVIGYDYDNENVFLFMLEGGWQQECGYPCNAIPMDEIENSKYNIKDISDEKCYWVNPSEERVYVDNERYEIRDSIRSLRESEDDGLGWARDIIKEDPIPEMIKLSDNKRFIIPTHQDYSDRWHRFIGWNNWYDVTGVGFIKDEDCYKITDGTWGDMYIPKSDINSNEKSYLKKMTESEEDDGLEWARDAASNLNLKYVNAFHLMDTDDIIEVFGDLSDNDDPPKILCTLRNNKFKVSKKTKDQAQITWLIPRSERPVGWEEVTNYKNDESRDNLVLYHGDSQNTGFNDNDLDITFIEKVDHPF